MNAEQMPEKTTAHKINDQLPVWGTLVVSLLLISVAFLIYYWTKEKDSFILAVIIFLFYTALITLLSLFSRHKAVRIILNILSVPGSILLLIGRPMQVLGSILYTYVTIVGLTIIGAFYSQELFHYQLQFSAGVYLVLTISSIAATTCSEWFIKSWHHAQNRNYKQVVERYSLLLFSQEKVRYVIFIIYFLLLTLFTFTSLNHIPLIGHKGIDIAILQSFATYVAFDRLVSNWPSFIKTRK